MKTKYCILILAVTMLFSLVSCQSAYTPSQGTDAATSQQATEGNRETATQPTDATSPLLDGSFSTPDYAVSVIDGKCYLNFTDGNEIETNSDFSDNGNMSIINVNFIRFDSLAEMKQKLVRNELSDEQKNIMKSKFTLSENGFEICNVQELIQPVVPAGISMGSVFLYGEYYTFDFYESVPDPRLTALMTFGNTDKWETHYQECMDVIEKHQLDSHEEGTFDGAPCEVFIYTTNTAQIKEVYITLPSTEQNTATQIALTYILQLNSDLLPVSDTVPAEIWVFGEKNGVHFDYLIQGLTEAPTVEWLSSFSIAPYVDTGDHVAS